MTHWWGRPWPSDRLRASVCEDDALRVAVPVGYACSLCDVLIEEHDQGISMMGIGADRKPYPVQEHIECNMRNVLGCYELVSTGATWESGHVCTGQDNYREDALKVWNWLQAHPDALG